MNNVSADNKNRKKKSETSTSQKIKHTLLMLHPTYIPFPIPHSEGLREEHSNSLWAQKLSCGVHVAPVVILSICVLATVVKAFKKSFSSSDGAFKTDIQEIWRVLLNCKQKQNVFWFFRF